MDSLKGRIAGVLRARRDRYVRTCEHLIALAPPETVRDHTPAAARQMTDGVLSVLIEALEERGNDVRTTYVETVVPSVVRGGVPLRGVVGGAVHLLMVIASDVALHMPPQDHEETIEWFGLFSSDYITQLAQVCVREGAK